MKLLTLHDSHFLAQGGERYVYRHPHRRDWCVKVRCETGIDPRQSQREVRDWRRLQQSGRDLTRFPQFRGWVATNRGRGVIWDLVLNHDATLAETLHDSLLGGILSPKNCRRKLLEYKDWMLEQWVSCRDLNPKNLVCQFTSVGDYRLVQVDGWGNHEFFPVSSWSPSFCRRKIERRWPRFMREVESLIAQRAMRASSQRDVIPFPAASPADAPARTRAA